LREVFTSGITFLIDEVAKTLKENHWKSKKIPEEKSASKKIIKKNYIAPKVKSTPEKDKQKIYFPESRVGPARKVTGQISINKSDAFLIWHTLSPIYNASLVERVAAAATTAIRRMAQV
jgi:hypothetical protein